MKTETQQTTAQHTAGPWHITSNNGICSESGLHITDVLGYGTTDEQDSANARLIASSPELLEALREAKRWLQVLPVEYRNKPSNPIASIDAVISKATGAP
jgi:hypothetical protein